MKILALRCCLSVLMLSPASLVLAQDAASPGIRDYPPRLPDARQEIYKRTGDVELPLYIVAPKDHRPGDRRPAIVFFFGGGWRAGTPGQFYPQCKYLASRGLVAITADYRVSSRHGVKPMDCVADAKSAIRWVRQNAERLGVDPDRIVASGGSAGGHLAAATGTVPGFDEPGEDQKISSVPNAMALFNPAVMLAPLGDEFALDQEKAASLAERTGGKGAEISPIHHVRKNLPPTIVFHGTNDSAVPHETVVLFAKRMREAGNRCVLASFAGQPHGFFNAGRGGSAETQTRSEKNFLETMRRLDQFLVSLGYLEGATTIEKQDVEVTVTGE